MYKFKQVCHEAHFTKSLSIQVCKLHESISLREYIFLTCWPISIIYIEHLLKLCTCMNIFET